MQNTRMWRHFDVWLLAAVAVLTIAGVAMIRSAIGGNENLAELVPRQAIYGLIGLVVLFLTAAIDYRIWSALARPMYIFVILSLGLILAAGVVGFGSARWFNVGIATIQPSELSKILMILVLSNYLARNEHNLNQSKFLARSLIVMGFPALLVFLQPDLSTAIVLGVIWLALVWASGAQAKHLAIIAAIGLLMPLIAWPFLEDYQKARVITFLFPDPDAQFGATYNVNQALITIGSGGLFGQGYNSGTQVQLRFLKVRHTDFIFSSMAQEFGLIGTLILIAGLSFIIFRCLRAARMARDTFGSLICYGIAILLAFQGFFNIAMNLKLLPVSGLPLPFFSYGGSSLFASLLAIGLVESVMLRHKQIAL
jgi:rod shape determining protein RodA